MPLITSYSDCSTLSKLDGRTRAGRLARSLRAGLVEHVGGQPTIVQRMLIDQACALRLGIASIDSATDAQTFLNYSQSLAQLIQQIDHTVPSVKHAAAEAA